MNPKTLLFGLAALLATGCFNASTPSSGSSMAMGDFDEDECLEDLDAMCACAEAAGTPCTVDDRNRYEDLCGNADARPDVITCIDEALICEDAVAACMP